MDQQKDNTYEKISDFMKSSRSVKITTYAILGIAGLYVAGHVFRIFAHAIRGFKEFSTSLKE